MPSSTSLLSIGSPVTTSLALAGTGGKPLPSASERVFRLKTRLLPLFVKLVMMLPYIVRVTGSTAARRDGSTRAPAYGSSGSCAPAAAGQRFRLAIPAPLAAGR